MREGSDDTIVAVVGGEDEAEEEFDEMDEEEKEFE
jgi:hypothetical protein